MEAIAADAGIAVCTVYSAFDAKREILSLIGVRRLEQAHADELAKEVFAEPDQSRRLRGAGSWLCNLYSARFAARGAGGVSSTRRPSRPPRPPSGSASGPAPLILVGHPGGLHKMYPRLAGRARHYAAEYGFAAAAIELPGSGDRPRSAAAEQARADLRRTLEAGEPVDEIVDALVLPLVEKAVPEWQATLDALLSLPEIGSPVGCEEE